MKIAIGTITLGRMEALGGNAIKTQFFLVGPLLFPLKSYYVSKDQGVPLTLQWKSVGLAYLRLFATLGALGCGFLALELAFDSTPGPAAPLGVLALALAVVAGLALCSWGKLSPATRRRREVLQALTGMGVDPGALTAATRRWVYRTLLQRWVGAGFPKDWAGSADAVRGPSGLLFALASYHAATQPSPRNHELRERAWKQLDEEFRITQEGTARFVGQAQLRGATSVRRAG